jgi:tetratricopeptide (TPR) repeat protein
LFYNESYCDIAILQYNKALNYINILEDNFSKANILKSLGNTYQLSNKLDDALHYYNESLIFNNNINNKLDIDKCIAQILFSKGEKDSAYILLKKNLNYINNNNVIYSYHCLLGSMYYNDKNYDSALYYLEETIDDSIILKKVVYTTILSSIYDSLGNYEKRSYYDNLSSKLFKNDINKEIDKSKIQTLYNNYNERKSESISIEAKARSRRITIISCLGAIIAIMFVFVYVRYNYKKQNDRLKGEINDYAKENKRLIDDFKKSNNKKDKIIKQQKKEISEIKNQFNNATGFNLEAYYDSDICKKILSRKDSDFSSLKEDELALLLKSANLYLNNISVRLVEQFPTLNHNDIYTICLIILNVEKNKLPHLLSRDRKTIWDRLDKIRRLMKIDAKQDLFIHIRDNYLH